jgi:hypothetical protein
VVECGDELLGNFFETFVSVGNIAAGRVVGEEKEGNG